MKWDKGGGQEARKEATEIHLWEKMVVWIGLLAVGGENVGYFKKRGNRVC